MLRVAARRKARWSLEVSIIEVYVWRESVMVTHGLLVRLETKPGKDADVEKFLLSALPLVQQEAGTTAWFAIRFGRSEYGIFDVFPNDAARDAHLAGPVAKALKDRSDALFAKQPLIQRLSVLADKLPAGTVSEPVTKALLLTFRAKAGHEQQVEQFLRDARPFVEQEPRTSAWFAIHLDNGDYGIFDVFPDNSARFSHLIGHVPRELAKHPLSLLGSMPDLTMIDVLAAKLPGQ
jgi:quinol monooxygenase YgiN